MSESVRYFLESRVPELEDLFKKGLFSKEEIKEIVSKRTKFEHKIKRRGAILEDFLAYIQYETELEQTRKQRYEMLNIRSKHSVSDHSIVKYILSLYRRGVTKFRGNMSLWDQYINFARESKSDKAMPKILASALQLHPESVDIWIKAANWEFKNLNNPASARTLFLRGIRMNKESKSLWFEYFRMELEVANTLAEKKLEISEKPADETSEITVFDGAIPISIFKYAAKEVSLNVEDAYEYYRQSLEHTNLKAVSDFIETFVSENMTQKFAFNILQARDEVSSIDFDDDNSIPRFEKCMEFLNKALKSDVLSSAIISSVIEVLCLVFEKSIDHQEIREMISAKIKRLLESGEESIVLTVENYLSWINVAEKSMSSLADIHNILERALKKFPENSLLLQKKVTHEFNNDSLDLSAVCSSLSTMVKSSKDCIEILNSFFAQHSGSADNNLIELAFLAISHFVPSTQAIEYILEYSSEAELINGFDHSKITPEFCISLIQVLIEKRIFSDIVKKFVSKLSIFSTIVFVKEESSLALLKYSLIVGDIELCNRLYSKATMTLPPSSAEKFLNSFEKLKETTGVFII